MIMNFFEEKKYTKLLHMCKIYFILFRFCVAEAAFRNMRNKNQNQVIIITGESGAGKTEASKYVMKYIAAVSSMGHQVDHIKQQVNFIINFRY